MKWSTAICLCVAMCCLTFLISVAMMNHQQKVALESERRSSVTITPDPPKSLTFDKPIPPLPPGYTLDQPNSR
jgi:hypothetical protein